MRRKKLLFLGITAIFSAMLVIRLTERIVLGAPTVGPTVQITVQAATPKGVLHYQWRSTDGTIQNVNSATTTWTLPLGGGLHFAYVLVSNGLGGYTERRIGVNTDVIGQPYVNGYTIGGSVPLPNDGFHGTLYAPPATAQVGDYYRARAAGPFSAANTDVYVPNATAFFEDLTTGLRYPSASTVPTNTRGEFIIPGVPPSNFTQANPAASVTCDVYGLTFDCTPSPGPAGMEAFATTQYLSAGAGNFISSSLVPGALTLADGSPCGMENEFFGVHVHATATLVDATSKVLVGPVPLNEFGDYALPRNQNGATVRLACEGAPVVSVPYGNGNISPLATGVVAGVTPPTVTKMTATLNGVLLNPPNAVFLPPPANLPSDISPRADNFLAEKGLDSRLGACKYYQAIGAVKGCGTAGQLIGAIHYQDWQKAMKIGPFAVNGTPTYTATYINKVDLNLARVQQSITYAPNQTAAVVCNHLGATDFFNPTQADIDNAVENAAANKNLVACVAMDYTISPGVNNNQPFIRFYIFGPNGQLLPSVNLDGRREKFVPGTCVVCHGGDHYAGKFPQDGTGFANVGGHFLPYDAGNFEFASKIGLQKCNQEDAIYHLNQNILNGGPPQAETNLINGWYTTKGSVTCPATVTKVLNEDYVPASWVSASAPSAVSFYKNVIARSCRTCHTALNGGFNFDDYANMTAETLQLPGGAFNFEATVCGKSSYGQGSQSFSQRWNTMPNSLVTFNRFMLSYQNTVGFPDQAKLLQQFETDTGWNGYCTPVPPK
jgi:hypothetical protein